MLLKLSDYKARNTKGAIHIVGNLKSSNSKNINWIIVLRAIACMAVIMIHVIDGWTSTADITLTGARHILDDIILQPFIRWAVPVFIMVSGALLLNPDKDVSVAKIRKYIIKMLFLLITFGLFYCFIENIYIYGIKDIFKAVYMSVFNCIQEKSWSHIWYIYMLIGLYFITPILRAFVKIKDDHTFHFTITGLFIFSIVIPTINNIFDLKITTFYLESLSYITIYLLGYAVVYRNTIKESYIYIGGIIGFAGYVLVTIFKQTHIQSDLFIILVALAIVTLFSKERIKIKNNKIIDLISKDSLGIYIIHAFFLNLANKGLKLYPSILPIGIGEIAFFLVTLILSVISIEIMKRIPVVKKLV